VLKGRRFFDLGMTLGLLHAYLSGELLTDPFLRLAGGVELVFRVHARSRARVEPRPTMKVRRFFDMCRLREIGT
jgi:hypothetical protein